MRGLFAGLTTLDVVQLVERMPAADEKVVAADFAVAAGGPATNAAVAFAAAHGPSGTRLCRRDEAVLASRIPDDHAGDLARADLAACGVSLAPARCAEGSRTTVASILVTRSTGERAVASAADQRDAGAAVRPADMDLDGLGGYDIVVTDGYETDVALAVLMGARALGVPTVFDGGSRKPYTESLLPYVDVAIVSEKFLAGGGPAETFSYLAARGVRWSAVTRGGAPVAYCADGRAGELPVAEVAAVDTLGAGDFFHGAFAKAQAGRPLDAAAFVDSLGAAAEVASLSVGSFGTRGWLA